MDKTSAKHTARRAIKPGGLNNDGGNDRVGLWSVALTAMLIRPIEDGQIHGLSAVQTEVN